MTFIIFFKLVPYLFFLAATLSFLRYPPEIVSVSLCVQLTYILDGSDIMAWDAMCRPGP
jgi:hypothetical protein